MKISVIFAALLVGATSTALAHDGNNGWVTISTFNLWSNTYNSDTIRIEPDDQIWTGSASKFCHLHLIRTLDH